MRNYTIDDWTSFIAQYDQHITHVIVAHTNLRAYTSPDNKWVGNTEKRLEMMAEKAISDCRYALNCFNKLLYFGEESKVVKRPDVFRPLTFVTLEGAKATTDSRQTLHFNITLGNLPKHFTTADIKTLFEYAWCEKAKQGKNVWVGDYYRQEGLEWHSYTGKEANFDRQRVWGNNSVIVAENCWIPHATFAAS